MKALIIGAGRGFRLDPVTSDLPKCLLNGFGDKRLLDWTLGAIRGAGIGDVSFIGGYRIERVQAEFPDLKYFENTDWANNNILASLMFASVAFDDDAIVSYSDIVYTRATVERLLAADSEVSIVIDRNWRLAYEGRKMHPESEAEKVSLVDGRVVRIGKHVGPDEGSAEFIGLARFSHRVLNLMADRYRELQEAGDDLPFQRALNLRKSYLTDMLQELIGLGESVSTVDVCGGWAELDTPEDLERIRAKWSTLGIA